VAVDQSRPTKLQTFVQFFQNVNREAQRDFKEKLARNIKNDTKFF